MDALIGFVTELQPWHWWSLAGVLLVLELLTGTTYLLWPAVASGLVGLAVFSPLPMPWEAQLLIFAVATAVLTLFGDKIMRARRLFTDKPHLNERVQQLIGEHVVAVADFSAGRGRVKLGDTEWAAKLDSPAIVAAGAVLVVTGMEGVTLTVKPGA